MKTPQQSQLFAEEEMGPKPNMDVANQNAGRERLRTILDKMRAAASWPWKASTVSHYREAVWPSLLQKLPEHEAEFFRLELKAEAARLDAVD